MKVFLKIACEKCLMGKKTNGNDILLAQICLLDQISLLIFIKVNTAVQLKQQKYIVSFW